MSEKSAYPGREACPPYKRGLTWDYKLTCIRDYTAEEDVQASIKHAVQSCDSRKAWPYCICGKLY